MSAQAWVTLVVGIVATVGVLVTWRQKNDADRRSEWWRRTTWAVERSVGSDDVEAELGWKLLGALVVPRLVTKSDFGVLQVIAEYVALNETDDDDEGRYRGGSQED
jgi:hypothetical protein